MFEFETERCNGGRLTRHPQTPHAPTPLALRPKQAAKALGIGERLLWDLTHQGLIPHLRLGRAVLYPLPDLQRWLSEQSAEGGAK